MNEVLLGIEPTPEGLALHPCLPKAWKEAGAVYRYRGCRCDIRIRRPSAALVKLDGRVVPNPIPAECFKVGAACVIEVG